METEISPTHDRFDLREHLASLGALLVWLRIPGLPNSKGQNTIWANVNTVETFHAAGINDLLMNLDLF